MPIPPRLYQFLVGVFASFGSFLYGYDLGVIAEVIASGSFKTQFNDPDSIKLGVVTSLFTAGAAVGAIFAGPVGDFLGRRKIIMMGAIIYLFGGGLQTGSQNLPELYAGRFFAGLGVGFLTMIIPLYQAELAHPDIRGRITALQQFMLGIGALCAGWIAYGTYTDIPSTSNAQWRVPLSIQMVPAIPLAILILLFPESPRWLIDHGRAEEGLRVLAKLHAHGDEHDPWVLAEFEQINESITFEHEHEAQSYLELFKSKSAFRRLLIACSLQASVQMTGVSAIQYYSVEIFAEIGISSQDSLKYQAINSIIALIAEGLNMAFIDKMGRRWTLICGNLGNCVTFIISTILIAKFKDDKSATSAHWAFILMTWIYNFSFSISCGPLSWIIPAEIFDTHTRSKGVSIATFTSFAFNTMIGQVTDVAATRIGYRYYYLFIVCNLTNALWFYAILPETKKIPLEEMTTLFEKSPWIVAGKNVDVTEHDLDRRVELIATEKAPRVAHSEDTKETA